MSSEKRNITWEYFDQIPSESDVLHVSGISEIDFANGPGVRYTIFTQGCPHHCPGCHNPETWDMSTQYRGETFSIDDLVDELPQSDWKLSLTGGEPLIQFRAFITLLEKAEYKPESIWVWTGFTIENVMEAITRIPGFSIFMKHVSFIVTEPFEKNKRDTSLFLRGSSNQKIFQMKQEDKYIFAIDRTSKMEQHRHMAGIESFIASIPICENDLVHRAEMLI